MKASEEQQHLKAVLEASQSGDAASVVSVWRRLAPSEQEAVLFSLLAMPTEPGAETVQLHGSPSLLVDDSDETAAVAVVEETELIPKLADDSDETTAVTVVEETELIPKLADDSDETTAMAVVEETELIPKLVEDLRGLSGSERDDRTLLEQPAVPNEYWSRWLRRWKISAVVAAWAVTTVFAFTADTSTFGAMEWVVAMLGTVGLGGALVGTLLNFAVAAISAPARGPTAGN